MSAARVLKRIAAVVVGALVVAFAGLGVANIFGLDPLQFLQTDQSQTVLLKSVKDINEFHAAEGNFEVVVDTGDGDTWLPDIISGRQTLFVAAGTVDAYVDLSGLKGKDLTLSEDGKTVTIRLPEPQLDKPNLDHDRSRVFTQNRTVLARIADAIELPDQAQYYELGEAKMAAAAEASELRDQAAKNTEAMLTGMFGALGMQVTFLEKAASKGE